MPHTIDATMDIISEVTSLDVSELQPDDELSEVLQGQLGAQLGRLISALNAGFDIELNAQEIAELARDEDQPLTIAELSALIQEEMEL